MQEGQTVKVKVLSVGDNGKISLSIKKLWIINLKAKRMIDLIKENVEILTVIAAETIERRQEI